MAINHADTTDIHLFAYVAATDPGAVGAKKAWVDTSGTAKVLKVRNAANTGWDTVGSSGVAIGDSVTGATQGSLLFAGASGALAQDNSSLFWDSANRQLTVKNNGNDDALILANGNTNYGPRLTFKYNHTTVASTLFSAYNGGLILFSPVTTYVDIGGQQGVMPKLRVQGYPYETTGKAAEVNTYGAGVVGLGIKLAASQTADALQILDSSSAILAKFANNGMLELGSSGGIGLLAAWYGGSKYMQTDPANLSAVQFNNSFKLSWVNGIGINGQNTGIGRLTDGVIGVQAGSGTKGAIDIGSPTASTVALAIKLAASQTADALKVEDSSGNKLFSINSVGNAVLKPGNQLILSEAGGSGVYYSAIGATISDAFNSVANFSLYNRSYFYNAYGSFDNRGSFNLTKGSATDVVIVSLPALTAKAGIFRVTIRATDGTDIQCLSQILRWEAINKNGTYTTNIAVVSEGSTCSTGTITSTWSITTQTNQITFRCNSNPSITPSTHEISIQNIGSLLN